MFKYKNDVMPDLYGTRICFYHSWMIIKNFVWIIYRSQGVAPIIFSLMDENIFSNLFSWDLTENVLAKYLFSNSSIYIKELELISSIQSD